MRTRPRDPRGFPRPGADATATVELPAVDEGHHHDIPAVAFRRSRRVLLATICLSVIAGWGAYRTLAVGHAVTSVDKSAILWSGLFLIAAHQVVLAWLDRPFMTTPEQQAQLDTLPVIVNIPLYNESPEVVDRVVYAVLHQTRMPTRVDVVDDGTTQYDYSDLRDYWGRHRPRGVELRWIRQVNLGKRHAQARTFRQVPPGAIVITLDSDTTLTPNAIEELLKPFADPRVMSVAGVELAYNAHANLLTRMSSLRQMSWQLINCCALNRFGSILVNRGTCAAYRDVVVRDWLDGYLRETFGGKPVKYSDDSLLTLYALARGRAVQQLSAYQLAMYPERYSHQLRQWMRWMRGSTIRSLWRARYLPVRSYGWWINTLTWWQFVASYGAYIWVFIALPVEGRFSIIPVTMGLLVSYLQNLRNLLVRRSDETPRQQVDMLLLAPIGWLYSALLLRPLRLWAVMTCSNNAWGTRKIIEVGEHAGRSALAHIPHQHLSDTVEINLVPEES